MSCLLALFLIVGIILLCINIYGLFKNIEPDSIKNEHLRFKNGEKILKFEEALKQTNKREEETETAYAMRINEVISKRIAHIHWIKYENTRFNQLIPIWENYFLYFVGRFFSLPEFQRYHYVDPIRSLKRGVGVCGDKAMVLSQLLFNEGIENTIISFHGHVVVQVMNSDGELTIYDPDFGIIIPESIETIHRAPHLIDYYYKDKGLSVEEIKDLILIFSTPYTVWSNTKDFLTKRYWFEKVTYLIKWPFPIFMILAYLIFNPAILDL